MRDIHRLIHVSSGCTVAFLVVCGQPAAPGETDCAGRDHARAVSGGQHSVAGPAQTLAQWVDALAAAESGNREKIASQDHDGVYNYGCLQFRERTFRHFVRKFKLAPGANSEEVMSRLYDCVFQKRLALRMIEENPENWKYWRRTVKRIGLPPGTGAACDESSAPLNEIKDRSTSQP